MTTSSTRPLPTLPTELLLEIFRAKCFTVADLANLALVSRKFLPSVQEILYSQIKVRLNMPGRYEDETIPDACRLHLSTWRLLRTLQEKPKLAELVKTIGFRGREGCEHQSEIVFTPAGAVATFGALAHNSSSFSFDYGFDQYFDSVRQVLKAFAGWVEELDIDCNIAADDVESILTDFVQLRRLQSSSLETEDLVERHWYRPSNSDRSSTGLAFMSRIPSPYSPPPLPRSKPLGPHSLSHRNWTTRNSHISLICI